MIKTSKKDSSARVCYTFDNNLEKISIKEKKADGDVSVKILNQLKNMDIIVKQDNVFIVDKDAKLLCRTTRGEFKNITNLFNKEYFGMISTAEASEVICFYGDDGVGKDNNIVVKMINIRVSL